MKSLMMIILSVLLLISSLLQKTLAQPDGCGTGTFLDGSSNQCVCAASVEQDDTRIYLAGLMDTTAFPWAADIFQFTVEQINNGFHGNYSVPVEYDLVHSGCDETTAVQEYWKLRLQNGNRPPDGIIGARCSGASTSIARISGLEQVPQISPASNSAVLSDDRKFPFFSRMVAPDDERGEVGALVALLRHLGWDRLTILATDTQYAKDYVTEFRKVWIEKGGSVAYSDTFQLHAGGSVDNYLLQQVLDGIPTSNPQINSRIILLVAHSEHAYEILSKAYVSNFQPDTVWVGPSAWVGRPLSNFYSLPDEPGYIGVAPFLNRDEHYQNFWTLFTEWARKHRKYEYDDYDDVLPTFAAETVDAIVAMTNAIASVYPKKDGPAIVRMLRSLVFDGVSGLVEFTPTGDRKNPKYSVLNGQIYLDWTDVGVVNGGSGTVSLSKEICFASVGCTRWAIPEDSYPVPPVRLPLYANILIAVLLLAFVYMAYRYHKSHAKKKNIKRELGKFRNSVVGMRAVERDHVPCLLESDIQKGVEQSMIMGITYVKPSKTSGEGVIWCWQETESQMPAHDSSETFGDPLECWIKYDESSNASIENAYKQGLPKFSLTAEYALDLRKMEQRNILTGFRRSIKRVDLRESTNAAEGQPQRDRLLPTDLRGEPQMVLLQGDVVQISTQRDDGWAFGTKLHHSDEKAARNLAVVLNSSCSEDPCILCDTGWFPLDFTRLPTAEDLEVLRKKVASGDLEPPSHWNDIKDATVVQRHTLKQSDREYESVVKAFMRTLRPPRFNSHVKVIRVERIENFPMWQSYIVKRQTICYREAGHEAGDYTMRKALERFERSWLWHGSDAEVVQKVLQQGFNRSFCGKNATMYGKGVYFARDSVYSINPRYAVPDMIGHQYVMACRVVVGEYCLGRKDAVTPDVRDRKSHSLYDSTVDTMEDPRIYVTYHDAQAYPEYLIEFQVIPEMGSRMQ